MRLPKNQTGVPIGPRADWAIGSSVTAMANAALIAEESNLARGKAKPCKSAASKTTYPIHCWLSRGTIGHPPFNQAQLKPRISARIQPREARDRSGWFAKSRLETAAPPKLASPTTRKKPNFATTNVVRLRLT